MKNNLYQYILSHEEHKHIFVKAKGGLGKTTQLRFVESRLIERAKKGEKIVPIYIDVKNIDKNRTNPIFNEIHAFCGAKSTIDDVKDAFEKPQTDYVEQYKYYILIDAINEAIDTATKSKIVVDINSLSSHPNCIIIVTSRVYEEGLNNSFQKYILKPINEESVFSTIQSTYKLKNKIQSEKVNKSLLEILQIPLFLLAYLKAFTNENDYSRLYDDKAARKTHILDAYRNKILEELEPENRRDTELNEQTRFVLNHYLPAVAFQMVKAGKFKIELEDFEKILNAEYFAKYIKGSKKKRVISLLNNEFFNPSAMGAEVFALIIDNEDIWQFSHHIWRDYFCALHVINIFKNSKDFSELELYLDENIRQFIGELYIDNNGLCECDYISKVNTCSPMSPIESFMQHNSESLKDCPIIIHNLVEIMKISRERQLTAIYNNLNLKDVNFFYCNLKNSQFNNTYIDYSNFIPNGHSGAITKLVFIPNSNTYIASGSYDKTIRIFDVIKNKQIGKTLKKHTKEITALAFSEDSSIMISGGRDKRINIWDCSKFEDIKLINETGINTDGTVSSIVVLSNEGYFAYADWNNYVYLCSIENDGNVKTLKSFRCGSGGSQTNLLEIYNSKYLVCACSDGVEIWNIEDIGSPTLFWDSHRSALKNISTLTKTSHDDFLFVGKTNGVIRIINISNTQKIELLEEPIMLHNGNIENIVVSSDSRTLLTSGYDGFLGICNISDINNIATKKIKTKSSGKVSALAISGDSRRVVIGRLNNYINLYELSGTSIKPSGDPIGYRIEHNIGVCVSPNGSLIATGTSNGTINIFDVKETKLKVKLYNCYPRGWSNIALAFSGDNRYLFVATAHRVYVWNIDNLDSVHKTDVIRGYELNAGEHYYKMERIDDSKNLIIIKPNMYLFNRIDTLSTSLDNSELLLVGEDIQIWKILDKGILEPISQYEFGGMPAFSKKFNLRCLFGVPAQQLIEKMTGERDSSIKSLSMSYDKKVVASITKKGNIKYWDFTTEKCHIIKTIPQYIIGIDFSKSIIEDDENKYDLMKLLHDNGAIVQNS